MLSLTGVPMLASAVLVSGGVGAATVAVWGRFGRARLPVRAAGVLLTEVCLLLTAGLAVNRSQLFYPSWDDLARGALATPGRQPTAVPAGLDGWLRERAGADPTAAVTFTWRPAEATARRLSGPPTVVVPAGYLSHPTWSYPVVLVVAGSAWSDAAQAAAARSTGSAVGPAVLVFLRPVARGPGVAFTADTLAAAVPHDLSRDLRVTAYHWAVVLSGTPAALPRQVVLAAPGRFPAVVVADADPPSGLPAGVAVAVVNRPGARQPGAGQSGARQPGAGPAGPVVHLPASAATELSTALRWAVQQTPPPLATPGRVIDPGKTPRSAAHRHPHPRSASPGPVGPVQTPPDRWGPAVGGGHVSGR